MHSLKTQCWEKCCKSVFALLYSVAVNFLFLPFRWFCLSDAFLPRLLPSFSGYIMSLSMSFCRHEAVTHPSGVRLQHHWPPNPESYVTMAIPKLEHGAWKEGGAYSFTYRHVAPNQISRLRQMEWMRLLLCAYVCVCILCVHTLKKKSKRHHP